MPRARRRLVQVGALVDVYRDRLPPHKDIVVETVHAAFKTTRKADEQYLPPGRLRSFDLLIFDEGSQIDAAVWNQAPAPKSTAQPHTVLGEWSVGEGSGKQPPPICRQHPPCLCDRRALC